MNSYCKYCDSQKNSIVKVFENGVLVWAGCTECYYMKKELENAAKQKQV